MTGLRLRQEKKVQEAARLVKGEIRGPTEALRASEDRSSLQSRVWDETGRVFGDTENASCWARENLHCAVWMRVLIWALLEYPCCVLGRDVSLTGDIDAGMFPFAARMASIRPILFSGLFCLVLLSRINRERLIHFSRKTGYSKIRQVTMNETGVLTHNNIYKGT